MQVPLQPMCFVSENCVYCLTLKRLKKENEELNRFQFEEGQVFFI